MPIKVCFLEAQTPGSTSGAECTSSYALCFSPAEDELKPSAVAGPTLLCGCRRPLPFDPVYIVGEDCWPRVPSSVE
jgi:hypothetical protein